MLATLAALAAAGTLWKNSWILDYAAINAGALDRLEPAALAQVSVFAMAA